MPKNVYLLEQIGADAAENEHNCHEILPIVARRCRGSIEDIPPGSIARANFEKIFKGLLSHYFGLGCLGNIFKTWERGSIVHTWGAERPSRHTSKLPGVATYSAKIDTLGARVAGRPPGFKLRSISSCGCRGAGFFVICFVCGGTK